MDIIAIISGLVAKYPVVSSVLMVMGVLRAIFKPIMALAHAYVAATKSPNDDAALDAVEKSKIYTSLAFLLDYVASVKLP